MGTLNAENSAQVKELVLVPTRMEHDLLAETWPDLRFTADDRSANGEWHSAICGFGLVVAAAQTSRLLHQFQPQRVWLVGIAGSYQNQLELGSALCFDQVACYGIGVGSGTEFQSAEILGWKQWRGDDSSPTFGDSIELTESDWRLKREPSQTSEHPLESRNRCLLSVAAASANPADVEQRLKLFPNAIAEDMEGFAVAAACHLHQVPLVIVRGISNRAGDRNKSNWRIREAMQSAARYLREQLGN